MLYYNYLMKNKYTEFVFIILRYIYYIMFIF